MSLLFGEPRAAAVAAVRQRLTDPARCADEWLQVSPDHWAGVLDDLAGPAGGAPGGPRIQRFTRTNFRFDPARFLALRAGFGLPPGVGLQPLFAAHFDTLAFSVAPHRFWRDAASFAAAGGGYGTVVGDTVTAAAFAAFAFDRQLEIGIETHPDWRGRGHAQLACMALIEQCLARGLEPVWSCRRENTASWRLAQKLGFVPTCELPYYRLPAGPVPR